MRGTYGMAQKLVTMPVFYVHRVFRRFTDDKIYYKTKFFPLLCCECLDEKCKD